MKVLIIKPSSLGDVIHALPFLCALKSAYPDSEVDWIISRNLKGILEDNPLIDHLVPLNKDTWKYVRNLPETVGEMKSLSRKLRDNSYDMVIDLQGLLRSGLMALSAKGAYRIGFSHAREGSQFMYDKKISVNGSLHAVDKCLEVAKAIGADAERAEFRMKISEHAHRKINNLLGDIREFIVIVPSARWVTKRWPAENFASLIARVMIPCIVAGSRSDQDIAQQIRNVIDMRYRTLSYGPVNREGNVDQARLLKQRERELRLIDLCGKTDLKDLVALISMAKAVVTNDSGPMHIAAALGVPTVAIFGPTDPDKTGPYGWKGSNFLKVVSSHVECSPCRRKKRCKEFICMRRVEVDDVYHALKDFLD